ncbi:MAG: ribosome maturation factor RimP, partial [Anaerococcus sp.]|nr:ribosome maturation factor RimP [Anaerococcus sp.]
RNKDELLEVKLKGGEKFIGKIKEIKEDSLIFALEDEQREIKKSEIKTIKIEIVF